MSGEKVDFDQAKSEASAASRTNERSSIVFPYLDLDAAIEVAKFVFSRRGINSCPLDELAAEMGQTVTSGSFKMKTSTARVFDLIEKDGQSAVRLTDLGLRLADGGDEAAVRADAFLRVPLYSKIYDNYKGKLLPPAKALEREMQTLGVATKQVDKARHAFHRSAKQGGYFNNGEDRLVRPKMATDAYEAAEPTAKSSNQGQVADSFVNQQAAQKGGNGGDGRYHPFIEGLLQTLPEPNTLWTIEGRASWLEAAANIFKLMYKGDGKITVKAEQSKETGGE